MATADGLPMPSTELPAPSLQDGEADMDDDVLQLIRSIRLRSQGEAVPSNPERNKPPQGWEYDAAIDATLRAMERHPEEQPSPDYLSDTQAVDGEEGITEADRAELIEEMADFCRHHGLAPGTPHRAVVYVDRFLSARKLGAIAGEEKLWILGAAAVFAAAKYEDQCTLDVVGASEADEHAECSRSELLAAEHQLVAAPGYRLGGPTAYTFVDHFTRHVVEEEDEEAVEVRTLAHHLADMALLSYQCVAFLPSAVAASAILLAGLHPAAAPPLAWYTIEELRECVDAIYDVHEYALALPGGCSWMMARWEATHGSYSLPPRSTLADLYG